VGRHELVGQVGGAVRGVVGTKEGGARMICDPARKKKQRHVGFCRTVSRWYGFMSDV
jgi:hypothetical protein